MVCLYLPSPVTAVAFGNPGLLGVAAEDGTLRIYESPYNKVWKAVRNLNSEISSVVFGGSAETRLVWIACGQHVLCFNLDVSGMILARNDAASEIQLTDENDDILNEITLNGSHLAYTLDSGKVGVVNMKTQERMAMKASHANLCTSVSFVPDRPRELVSGGYDSALLHFDFHLGSLLSTLQIGPSEPSTQESLSPPFVLSVSVAQTGLVACGLADGRIWLGSGGEKSSSREGNSHARQKKRRKWEGLRASDGSYFKTAEGPVVAVGFSSPRRLFSLTLLGTLTLHEVENGHIRRSIWTSESPGLVKANALAVDGSHIVIGGVNSANKGIFILRPLTDCEDPESLQLLEAVYPSQKLEDLS